ncbi:hypothetical protein [Lacisediminihabitans profunda]|uniref:hypothetical protein n=1 Tax=Lacisediminihabitans profunda TaxID=2594790 RepID=UPI00164FE83B|nr:hypothetical protein [Lacisediminihabitans profunda]
MFVSRVSLAIVLAMGLALAPLASAFASATTVGSVAADPNPARWSVQAANSSGPDGRESFAYAVNPGTQINDYVAVSNQGTTAQTFTLYGTDAVNEYATGAFSLLPSSTPPKDSGSWVKLSQPTVTLQPGIQARIPFTMLVPSDATPGDHTAGIVASVTQKSTDKKGKTIVLEERVGARIYLDVSGALTPRVAAVGVVSGFTSPWNPFGGGSSGVDYAVTNVGNSRVDVTQTVSIRGLFGIPLATFDAGRLRNVLPGQSVHTKLDRSGIAPLFLLWSTVTLKPIAPTDRVAQSSLRKADGSPATPRGPATYKTVSSETLTGAIPWTLLVLVLVLVGAVYLLARYVAHTRERLYEAIDAASADAREKALGEARAPQLTKAGADQ